MKDSQISYKTAYCDFYRNNCKSNKIVLPNKIYLFGATYTTFEVK